MPIRRRDPLLAIFFGLALIAASGFLFTLKTRPANWPTTTGTVDEIGINAANRRCVPFVVYTVAGRQFSFADTGNYGPLDSCRLAPGDTLTVRYNPNQPADGYPSKPGPPGPEHFYLGASLTLAAGLLALLGGIIRGRLRANFLRATQASTT